VSGRGRFISLEGGEGAGKSTQVSALAQALRKRGIDVVETREPGGSAGAEKIRELLLTGDDDRWSAQAEALLFRRRPGGPRRQADPSGAAAGQWVVCDRFVDSSLAYQGGAGKLGIEAVRAINAVAIADCFPDRTLVLALAEGGARARARDNDSSDRIGGRSEGYHQQVDLAFRQIAAEEPRRVRIVDARASRRGHARLLERIAGPAAVISARTRRSSSSRRLASRKLHHAWLLAGAKGGRQGALRARRGAARACRRGGPPSSLPAWARPTTIRSSS
jgi:dTMP kinase